MEGVIGSLIGLVVVVLIFGSIPAIIIASQYFKNRERLKMQEVVRLAIEKGQPLPPDIVDAISRGVRPMPSANRDLRTGIIWLAVAAGLACFAYALGYSSDGAEGFWPMLGLSAFPAFIGLAFVIMGLLNRSKDLD
jgi:hypothetical protein